MLQIEKPKLLSNVWVCKSIVVLIALRGIREEKHAKLQTEKAVFQKKENCPRSILTNPVSLQEVRAWVWLTTLINSFRKGEPMNQTLNPRENNVFRSTESMEGVWQLLIDIKWVLSKDSIVSAEGRQQAADGAYSNQCTTMHHPLFGLTGLSGHLRQVS